MLFLCANKICACASTSGLLPRTFHLRENDIPDVLLVLFRQPEHRFRPKFVLIETTENEQQIDK